MGFSALPNEAGLAIAKIVPPAGRAAT
jgi:hypothetical protein